MRIEWDKETMATGVRHLDEQHRQLLQTMNDLSEAVAANASKESIYDALDFLTTYVMNHFSDEEEMMERRQCPAREGNRKAHTKFRMDLADLNTRFAADGPSSDLAGDTLQKLLTWFASHIRRCDTQLNACAHQAGSPNA